MLKFSLTAALYLALLIKVLSFNVLAADAQPTEKEIYKKTDKSGVVEFTDMPSKDTKPIRVPPMNTFKQKPLPRKAAQPKSPEAVNLYTQFAIVSPSNNTEVRENAGNVSVQISINPPLKSAHTIKVTIDNGEKTSLTGSLLVFNFANISRGTHKVQAFILDPSNNVIMESAIVEFHLKRFIFKPPAPKAKP